MAVNYPNAGIKKCQLYSTLLNNYRKRRFITVTYNYYSYRDLLFGGGLLLFDLSERLELLELLDRLELPEELELLAELLLPLEEDLDRLRDSELLPLKNM